jgi:hypothetical protein
MLSTKRVLRWLTAPMFAAGALALPATAGATTCRSWAFGLPAAPLSPREG